MIVNYIKELAYNDKIAGHAFTQPALWYGRQIQAIFAPLETPPATYERFVEMAQRIRQLVLVILLPLAVLSFVLGIAIKHYNFVPPAPPSGPNPPSPVNPHSGSLDAEDLSQPALEILQSRMEAIFNDLPKIHAEAGREIEHLLGQFEVTWARNPVTAPTSIKEFQHLKSTFFCLKNMQQSLFLTEYHVGEDGVMIIPKDGNCFFHSLIRGLTQVQDQLTEQGLWNPACVAGHEKFRAHVVDIMRRNIRDDRVLQGHVDSAIEAYMAVCQAKDQEEAATLNFLELDGEDVSAARERLRQGQRERQILLDRTPSVRYEAYFNKIATLGFFASIAEIYTVSRMFRVGIGIERHFGDCHLRDHDTNVNPEGSPVKIMLILENGNHFNLKVLQKP